LKRVFIILTSLLFAGNIHAQYISRLGRFQVDQVKGCAPFTVTILDTNLITTGECTVSKPCLMRADTNAPPQPNQFTILYPQAGTFKLSILYQNIGADDITVVVDPNVQPAFEVYTCSGLQTSIKITDKSYDQYYVDFNNDGISEVVMPNSNNQTATHNYGVAGNFNISIRGKDVNAADNCNAEVQAFTSMATLPVPKITTLTALDASQLKIDFTAITNVQFKLEIAVNNSNVFQQFQTLYGVNSVTVPNLQLEDNYYCFRLSAYDPCTNSNTYSFPVCSQNFDLNIQSGLNKLSWATSGLGVITTDIIRNGATYTTIPGSPASFNDVDVICNTNYCYQVVNVYPNGTTSISLEKCGDAFTTTSPSPVNNTSSVVSADGVKLTWKQDPLFNPFEYTVLRAENNGMFNEVGKTSAAEFTDTGYTTESNSCYRINYSDQCDNQSQQGSLVCPVKLSYTIDNKNVITLRWSKLKGWNNGVKQYSIEKYDKSGGLMNTINVDTDTVFVDDQLDLNNQVVQYRILATANEPGLITSISNQVVVTKGANLFYPTAFTPDGTGPVENETFSVFGQFIVKMELKIFDRWGTMVFFTDENVPWDGTQNSSGKVMPEGTYVWIAKITDMAGRNFSQEGTVVILKKTN
jgi:gliding motility-associated-like protein